jgi:hypothetical protein
MPHDIHDINTPIYRIMSMTASLYSLSFQLSGITPITPFSNTLPSESLDSILRLSSGFVNVNKFEKRTR